MKKLVVIIILGILVVTIWGDILPAESPKQDLFDQAKEILDLIKKLESSDQSEKNFAFKKLIEIGQPVIPFLLEKLKDKSIYLELACQIQAKDQMTPTEAKLNMEMLQQLMRKALTDQEVALIEKYFYSRYLEAVSLYKKQEYEYARQIIEAIIKLEPNLSFVDKLRKLQIFCEEKILQKKVLKATLSAKPTRARHDIYEIGEKITLTLTLENLTLYPVEIVFGKDNIIVLNVMVNEYGPYGGITTEFRMEEIKLKEEHLSLQPLQTWQVSFELDTSKDNPRSLCYRTYDLTAEIRPLKLKSQEGETIRKIGSSVVTLRCFPQDVDPVLKNPLASLGQALSGGIPIDIFLCALAVPDEDRDKVLNLLMSVLDKSSGEVKKTILVCLRHITRMPIEIDESAWKIWWESRQKKK